MPQIFFGPFFSCESFNIMAHDFFNVAETNMFDFLQRTAFAFAAKIKPPEAVQGFSVN